MLSTIHAASSDPAASTTSTFVSADGAKPADRPSFSRPGPVQVERSPNDQDGALDTVGLAESNRGTRRRARPRMEFLTDLDKMPPRHDAVNHVETLRADLAAVKQQVKTQPRVALMPAPVEASYAEACGLQGGFSKKVGERHVTGSLHAEWIEITDSARVNEDHGRSSYGGDKIHLSVNRSQMDEAFPIVLAHLCADGTPFQKMKMSNLAHCERTPAEDRASANARRVTEGAQVTLYIHPADDGFTATQLARTADAVHQLEAALQRAGIMAGLQPASDVAIGRYASYRNERHADREGSQDDRAPNLAQPVYQCLMARYAAS